MPKITANVGSADKLAGAKPAFKAYAGPTPPKDVYHGLLKQLSVPSKPNKNGDYMLRGMVEIQETGRKAKYNGYAIWFRQNISEQGAPYVNQFLDAISGGSDAYRKAFWAKLSSGGLVTDNKDKVTKLAGKRYVDGTMEVVVAAKDGRDQNNNRILEIGSWLTSSEAEAFDDADPYSGDDDEDDDDLELEEADEDESEADEDEDAEDDEDEDESEADEDEDEDEDEEDEDEEESEEEEDEDDSEARRNELEGMERKELVAIAKKLGIKAVKSKTDEAYITEILEAEAEEPPF
jgi:hypothetical protein